MNRRFSIAIAAGLLLAGPALADDADQTLTKDQLETRDQLRTKDQLQTKDQLHDPAAGIGDQVRTMARDQVKGEGATGIGDQVREMARDQARDRVRDALAEQAGMPAEPAALPGDGSGEKAAGQHAMQARKMEAERAALRHVERKAAREQLGEAAAARKGAGGGHGAMAGSGPGAGDCTQAAETTRTGGMHGAGAGGMTPGGMR